MGSLSRRILVGILVPALAMGCSHTLHLGPQAPPERWQKAQQRLEGRKAEVVLRDGRRFRADGVEVSPEAVSPTPRTGLAESALPSPKRAASPAGPRPAAGSESAGPRPPSGR